MFSKSVETLLDVGCGNGDSVQEFKKRGQKIRETYLVGADIWPTYLTRAKKVFDDVVRCDIRRLPFRSSSFDVVTAMDILEHLGKVEGQELLKTIEDIGQGQVFVFTPVGYMAKRNLEDNNPWQAHRSGWGTNELRKRGYQVFGMNGGKFLYRERGEYKVNFRGLRPIMSAARLVSQIVTFRLAEGAYRMLCVKNKHVKIRDLYECHVLGS
jgi:ubiquinone/menaquinone biosynthesis C-methylase UbiE